jgi:Pentapeptide repeats (8 copies)
MIRAAVERKRPESWAERRKGIRHGWMVPFWWFEHGMEWFAYALSHWSFLDVLEYLSSFGVLIAVIFYFAESGDRLKQKHYQAWQVINTAQGKGGNGGRIDALQELNADGIPMVGVDLSSAFLQGIRLKKVNLSRADFAAADARDAEMQGAVMENANLRGANFRGANLGGASLRGSALDDGDFSEADLRGADLSGTSLENVDLRGANLEGVKWEGLRSVKGANVFGVKGAPAGFLEWVVGHGGVRTAGE